MKRYLYIVLCLLTLTLVARANEITDSIACGRWVTLTATPDSGYHFVRWSDGNVENPRRLYIDGDIRVVAEFERNCDAGDFPVLRLYDWILMLNADSLHAAGYSFGEDDVSWYRIVGDTDPLETGGDDILLAKGYYLSMDQSFRGTGSYYALIQPIRSANTFLCSERARSEVVHYEGGYIPAPERQVTLAPTRVRVGEPMTLTGLLPDRPSHVLVYDLSGRRVAEFTTDGSERVPLRAATTEGVYLVRVEDNERHWIFRYVATH